MKLKYLLENECYHTSSLLSTSEFIKLCKSCGFAIDESMLEYYEQKKYFFPFARIKYPWHSAITSRGWTRVFNWKGEMPQKWHDNNILWAPENRRYLPWKHFYSKNGDLKYQSYYSRFQILHYHKVSSYFDYSISIRTLLSSELQANAAFSRMRKHTKLISQSLYSNRVQFQKIGWLCQCISDRYYPQVLTNLRKIVIPNYNNINWYEYRHNWNAKTEFDKLNISLADLELFQKELTGLLLHIDPLYEWHDLVAFINIDKKKLLSGKAQFAQQLYLMELMIRLFYEDLTRKQLSAPYYRHLTELSYNHGVNNEESSLPFLKFIANRYCINPQPKMILICEGESDKTIYSAVLKDIFGRDPSVLGIFFMDIGGVGNAVGSKKHDRRMALKHLIDYQHQLMTIVFVILDNEGGAQHSLSNIYTSRSIWDPNRMVTCKEYTKVWKNCLEIDNFFSEEIALALNRVAQTYNLFNANDVENAKNEKGDCLTLLFKKKVHAELSKPSLAKELAKIIIEKCLTDENPYKSTRPILVTLKRIIWMCSRISLPISQDDEVRQRKFWFSSNYAIRDKRYHDWINEPLMDTE